MGWSRMGNSKYKEDFGTPPNGKYEDKFRVGGT